MCDPITAAIAVVTIGAAAMGTVASISSANANAKAAKFEAAMKNRQAYRQREQERIASLQTENKRTDEFQQARSSALAAIGASGLGEHISFFQSIDPEARKAFLRDVTNIRLNMTTEEASIADQVQVTEFKKNIDVFNAKMTKVGAIADFIQTAMSAANMAYSGGTPKPAKAG